MSKNNKFLILPYIKQLGTNFVLKVPQISIYVVRPVVWLADKFNLIKYTVQGEYIKLNLE